MGDTDVSALSALRAEVRQFIAQQREAGAFEPTIDGWLSGWDENFTRALAEQGWVGMTIPVEYGGRGRTFSERFVVTEELLAAGAPVSAHWIADRQIAPSLLKYGTEEQREHFLPSIARGERYFAIGMSESDAGSDLANVQTRATAVEGGWRLNGSKIWTSNAHRSHAFFVLVRTSPRDESNRHGGLSQFIVDLAAPGVTVNPIVSLDGSAHFNEVVFDGVFVADGDVLGTVGEGWKQVTSELKFERSGPERILSTFPVLDRLTKVLSGTQVEPDNELGRIVARITGLRHLSFDVAMRLERGESAELTASMVKVLGTRGEGDIAAYASAWLHDASIPADAEFARLVELSMLRRPGFTLRGGTNEILRGIIARGLEQSHGN